MNAYNGFTPEQRNKAGAWLNQQWNRGNLKRPTRCCSCGQTQGIIHAHAEDYSEPFMAGKTDQYHLCYACHMIVHCRFGQGKTAFLAYCSLLRQKRRVEAFTHSAWEQFKYQLLGGNVLRATEEAPEAIDLLYQLFGSPSNASQR